jgi:hypothetical protein
MRTFRFPGSHVTSFRDLNPLTENVFIFIYLDFNPAKRHYQIKKGDPCGPPFG